MMREKIAKLIEISIKELQEEKKLPDFEIPEVLVEYPKEKVHGDYATNIALVVAKKIKRNPMEIAEKIKNQIGTSSSQARAKIKNDIIERIEVVQPGFINFFLSEQYLQRQGTEFLFKKELGSLMSNLGQGKKINIEFISANPTGPLTLGNGRGGFCGDVLANILKKAGYKVTREYYINDVGEQIRKLGHSVIGDSEAVYRGDYIELLKKRLGRGLSSTGSVSTGSAEKIGEKAAKIILKEMIEPTVKKMGIGFDVWFSEKSLYKSKEVDKAIEELTKKGFTYESEKAVWFKSKNLGDDKDRVLIRSDGIKTYFASDIAYLKNKFKRGFKQLIFFIGADHYGYVARLKAAAEALGYKKEQLRTIVMQLVRLFQDGKEVKMSKRTGIYVTIDELIDEVGLDAARFFFLIRSPDTHLNFDIDLAREKSEKNPVYYVQYANARIHSIIAKSKLIPLAAGQKSKGNLKLLKHSSELALIKQLIKFPEIIEDTSRDYQIQRVPQYAIDLADAFHQFYENCRVLSEDKKLSQARLALISATKVVLKNTLDLMGISAPEKM